MKKYLAEFVGTFALILVGAGAGAMVSEKAFDFAGLLLVALAHGLTVATMIYALGHISGIHINPAVSVAMFVTGKLPSSQTIGYIIAQLAGAAVAGYVLLYVLQFDAGIRTNYLGLTTLQKITPFQGFLCEAIGTFLFFTVIFGAAVDGRTAGNMVGLAIGLSLASLILLFGPLTGAAFNPARTFGPALASGHWENFWTVYVAGPIVGGSLAGLLQTRVFMKA
jgi:MIP family channel proteins